MSSPFGGPSGNGNNQQDSSDNYRSNLGYGRTTSSSPSDYSGTGQTPYSNPSFGSQQQPAPNTAYGGVIGNYDLAGGSERTPLTGYSDATGLDVPFSKDYKFTAEEMRVVKECTRESFYYRSLPLALLGAAATHLGIKQGYLLPHPKYGSMPKVIGLALTGFLLGKITYWNTCQEKFLQLPDSRVADAIRRRRSGQPALTRTQQPGWSQPLESVGSAKVYDGPYPAVGSGRESRFDPQVGQSRGVGEQFSGMNTDDYHNPLDIDSEKNSYYDDSSLDERRPNSLDFDLGSQPGVGFVGSQSAQQGEDRQGANYDELRRRHRDAYERPRDARRPSQ